MFVIRLFLGSTVTMDSIIFNRYEDIVIDLRGRAGVFANAEVRNIINNMYSGFEWLAIIVFIVILLYLGIQIIISVGTDKQSKYFKHLQNWVVGVALLFLLPRFFPFITDISNAIVSYIGRDSSPMYTQYNFIALLDDESVIGENAQTVQIKELTATAINARKAQIEDMKKQIGKLENANATWSDIIINLFTQIFTYSQHLFNYYNWAMEIEIKNYVDDNINNWSYLEEEHFNELIQQHRDNNVACTSEYLEKQIAKLQEYKNNSLTIKQLYEEIAILESYGGSGTDLMSTMRTKAGETGRIIYAIIWLVLMFQMISLLAMYYKRIIMIAILLMIFPIIMITYAIDKINDGSAQTFETWLKEFTINIIVQIAHAVIYVILVQTGLDIYQANPDNWLFLLMAVLFLFPGERILRAMFGMNGSTIGSLKANVGSGMMLAGMAVRGGIKGAKLAGKGAKGAVNLGKDIKNKGFKATAKDRAGRVVQAWQNYGSKEAAARNASDRKRQAVADRKKQARDMNIQRRRAQMVNASLAKKAMLKTVNAASMVRNGMYRVGNAGRKLKRAGHKVQNSFAGKSFKLATSSLRRVAGLSAGIVSGATTAVMNSGKNGVSAGIIQGVNVGKSVNQMVGGVKPKNTSKASTASTHTPRTSTKNMPAGQKYKKARPTGAKRVKKGTTKANPRTKTRIKGTKKVTKKINKKTTFKKH